MAASSRISLNYMENGDISSGVLSSKQNELQKKMEKLHRCYMKGKEWKESIKVVQQSLSRDKKMMMEDKESGTIRSCVDRLQSCVKVVSQQTLLERLETSARQVGLMFSPPVGSEKSAIISSEMFRIEIIFDPGGLVKDARVSHQGEPTSCDEILEVLRQGSFEEFIVHMKGLQNIYDVPGDRKQKSKCFLALQALEADLNGLAQLQSSIKGVSNCIHKSPLGILLPRKGGYSMKLVYHVSPYDLLDKKSRSPHPLTVEAITEHGLGQSVTICIEPHTHRRLQSIPLMSVIQQDGKSLPSFQALSQVNSTSLPACFTLVLAKPIPVAASVIQAIQEVTDIDVITEGKCDTLLNLVLSQSSRGKLSPDSEFFVTLPDQQHVYYLRDVGESSLHQMARMVSRVPFTHPTNVANILNQLRQQLLYNTVVSSCIRPYAKQDLLSSVVFEVVCTSLQHFTIMFEHPLQDTMVTAEVDLSDITGVKFKVSIGDDGEDLLSDDAASKIFQRCMSIPVTLRSVIHKVSEQLRREPSPEPVEVFMDIDQPSFMMPADVTFATPYLPPSLESKNLSHPGNIGILNAKIPPGFGGFSVPNPAQGGTMLPPPVVDESKRGDPDVPSSNPLLVTLLDQDSPDPEPPAVHESPMLSKLLEDAPVSSRASTINNNNNNVAALASSVPVPLKSGRGRPPKRKSLTEPPKGKSPKQRFTDSELQSHSFDSVSSFDSDFQSMESSRSHHVSLSSPIDLTDDSLNPLKRLENTLDSIQGKQSHLPNDSLADLTSELDPMQDIHMFNQTNSVPKNMAKSTSLEGILNRSGEVSRTKDLHTCKPHHLQDSNDMPNNQARKTLVRQNSVGRSTQFQNQMSIDSNDSFKAGSNLSFSHSTSFTQGNTSDSDISDRTSLYSSKSFDISDSFNISPRSSSSLSHLEMGETSEIKPELKIVHKDLRSLLLGSPHENSVHQSKELKIKNIKGKMRMKLSGIKNSDLLGMNNKKSSAEAYDFNSDEEDSNDLRMISSSPGLHLFNKSKNTKHYLNKYGKTDKLKKKEVKNAEPGKRKRDKKEKEHKKRKRLESNSRVTSCEMYSATPVESEDKTSTKLKIIKSIGHSMENSPRSSPSSRDKGEGMKKYEGKSNLISQKSVKNSHKSLSMSSVNVSKEDSKLMTKTPKIKLKPIAIPTSSSVSSAKTPTPTSGSSTPTSTTIGRIGAVSILTSGNSKTGTLTPPPGKVSNPISAKTPPSIVGSSKTFPSNKNVSSTSQKAATVERKLSQSSRSSFGMSKSSNGKYSSDRKSNSPSLSGSKSGLNSSKSLNSSSKGQSSTSFGKNSTNPLNSVLSFLNPKDKGLSSLPRIPKISSASTSNVNNTKTTVSMTTIAVTTTSTMATSVAGMSKTTTVNSHTATKVSVSNQYQGGMNNSPNTPGTPKTPTNGSFSSNTKSNVNVTAGAKGNILGGNSPTVRGSQLGNRSPSINNSSNNKSPSSTTGKSPLSHANKPGNVNRQNFNSNPPKTPVGSGTSHPLKTPPSSGHGGSPNINKLSSNTSTNNMSRPNPQVSPSNYTTKSASGQSISATNLSRNSSSPGVSQSPTSKALNNVTKAHELSVSVLASSKVTSPLTVSLDTPPKTTTSSMVSPTAACPSSNSKIRPRKSSLSAVIDKLTNAKVPHGLGGETGRHNSVDESEQTKQKGESPSASLDRSNSNSEKPVSDLKHADSSDKNVPTKDVVSGIDKNKDYKIVDNSRNLFASLLKSASENFSSRHDKDDKENVVKSEVSKSMDVNEDTESKKDLSMQMLSKKSPKMSPKVNGETSSTADSARNKGEGEVFKVPTPKSVVTIDENDCEDIENISVRRKARISTTKPVLSPASSGGSPENLIIDCQSPRQNISKNNSPKCVLDLSEENKKLSPVTVVSLRQKTHTPSPKPKPSPNPSPKPVQHSSPAGSLEIDDDLMNEAIMGFTS